MKKSNRILAIFAAVLMLFCCTVPTFAVCANTLKITITPAFTTEPYSEPSAWDNFKDGFTDVLNSLLNFWHRFAVLIIVILLLAAIVIAITISEFEQQKIREGKKPPKKSHKKK